MTAVDFISKYVYRSGWPFVGGWQRIDSAPYAGACDDFATTVLYSVEGSWLRVIWALLTFRAVFWLVNSPVNKWWWPRHIVLWHKEHGWIDSTNREWRQTATPHTRVLPLLWPWALFRMAWGGVAKMTGVGK